MKALPQSEDPAAQDQAQTPAEQPPELQPPHQDDARPWAGDMYDEGDESDPAQAFAAFSGQSGEQAWLDKADDGTLTGWVRDETGQVYRYSDPDAWAIDVDDAGMTQTGGTGGQPADGGQGPAGQVPADPNADPYADPAAADPYADPMEEGDDGGLSLDYGTADEAIPADGSDDGEDPEGDGAEDEDDDPKDKKKGKPWE